MIPAFRPAASEDDLKFVISSWLDATKYTHTAGLIQVADFYAVMWEQYAKALGRSGMRTIICYEKRDPSFLYGWIAADPGDQMVPGKDGAVRWHPGLVLFVLVKQNYRREGIARKLFAEVNISPGQSFIYACNTPQASRLESKFPRAKFSPVTARFPKEQRP